MERNLYNFSGLNEYLYSPCIATRDEKCIIFFESTNGESNEIMIFNRNQQKLLQCKIKCPMTASFNATLIYGDHRDEVLTFGFIKGCFRSSQFKNMRKLPHYLIKLIGKWMEIAYVHLICHYPNRLRIAANKIENKNALKVVSNGDGIHIMDKLSPIIV